MPKKDVSFIWNTMKSFWKYFQQKPVIETLWSAYLDVVDNLYLQLYQINNSKSLNNIPVFWYTNWEKVDTSIANQISNIRSSRKTSNEFLIMTTASRSLNFGFGTTPPAILIPNSDIVTDLNNVIKYYRYESTQFPRDYRIDYINGTFTRTSESLIPANGNLKVQYDYAEGIHVINPDPIQLFHDHIIVNSEILYRLNPPDNQTLKYVRNVDYIIDYAKGILSWIGPNPSADPYIPVEYLYDLAADTQHPENAAIEFPYKYAINKDIIAFSNLQDLTLNPNTNLQKDIDYQITEKGVVGFKAPVAPDAMWAPSAVWDMDALYKVFGYPIQVSTTPTRKDYLITYGLWYSYWHGCTIDSLERGLNVVLGMPFAFENGTVTNLTLSATEHSLVINGTKYILPIDIPPAVSNGQSVTIFQPLVYAVRVWDHINNDGMFASFPDMAVHYADEGYGVFGEQPQFADTNLISDNGLLADQGVPYSTGWTHADDGLHADTIWDKREDLKAYLARFHNFIVEFNDIAMDWWTVENLKQIGYFLDTVKPNYTNYTIQGNLVYTDDYRLIRSDKYAFEIVENVIDFYWGWADIYWMAIAEVDNVKSYSEEGHFLKLTEHVYADDSYHANDVCSFVSPDLPNYSTLIVTMVNDFFHTIVYLTEGNGFVLNRTKATITLTLGMGAIGIVTASYNTISGNSVSKTIERGYPEFEQSLLIGDNLLADIFFPPMNKVVVFDHDDKTLIVDEPDYSTIVARTVYDNSIIPVGNYSIDNIKAIIKVLSPMYIGAVVPIDTRWKITFQTQLGVTVTNIISQDILSEHSLYPYSMLYASEQISVISETYRRGVDYNINWDLLTISRAIPNSGILRNSSISCHYHLVDMNADVASGAVDSQRYADTGSYSDTPYARDYTEEEFPS